MPFDKLMAPSSVEGLKPIEDHVLEHARAEAAGIVAKALADAARVAGDAREESERRLKGELDRLRAELDATLDRELAGLRAARAQELLRDKSRLLDDVFRKAAARLLASPGYRQLLRRRLRDLAGRPGTVLCRAEDRDAFARILAELARETGGKMPDLADEPVKILGGFTLRGEQFDLDYTLESELAALRERVLGELAAKAFPDS